MTNQTTSLEVVCNRDTQLAAKLQDEETKAKMKAYRAKALDESIQRLLKEHTEKTVRSRYIFVPDADLEGAFTTNDGIAFILVNQYENCVYYEEDYLRHSTHLHVMDLDNSRENGYACVGVPESHFRKIEFLSASPEKVDFKTIAEDSVSRWEYDTNSHRLNLTGFYER